MVTLRRSILENTFEPCKSSRRSFNRGIGKRYLTVILLMALLSTHIRHSPFFLGTESVGTAHGLKDSLMSPFLNNSPTCLRISLVSLGLVLQAGLLGNTALGTRSLLCWMSLGGGSPGGISVGKTSLKLSNKGIKNGWLLSVFGVSSSSFCVRMRSF